MGCQVICIFMITHYGFASTTAHVVAMYTPLVNALIASGCPPKIAAVSLGIASAIMGCCSPYGSGSAPQFFATGYVSGKVFWMAGAIFLLLNMITMCSLGIGWWSILGYAEMDAK